MFTGIIQDVGTITKIRKVKDGKKLTIRSALAPILHEGASIAVDGACLTVENFDEVEFTVHVIEETLLCTIVGNYKVGTKVNLEPALKVGESLDGHIVQGHVDGTATIHYRHDGREGAILDLFPPQMLLPFIAQKGSITVNGVSLTVVDLFPDDDFMLFSVALIPHTLAHSNLSDPELDEVNIEVDTVARYLDRLTSLRIPYGR